MPGANGTSLARTRGGINGSSPPRLAIGATVGQHAGGGAGSCVGVIVDHDVRLDRLGDVGGGESGRGIEIVSH